MYRPGMLRFALPLLRKMSHFVAQLGGMTLIPFFLFSFSFCHYLLFCILGFRKHRLKKRKIVLDSSTDTDVPSTSVGQSRLLPRKLALSESAGVSDSSMSLGVANLFDALSSDPQRSDQQESGSSSTDGIQRGSQGTPSLNHPPKTLKPAKSNFSISKLKQKFGRRLQAAVQGDTTGHSTSGNESDSSALGVSSADSYRFGVSDIIPLEAVAQEVLFEETVATEQEIQEDGIVQETDYMETDANIQDIPDVHVVPEGIKGTNATPNSVNFSDNCPDVIKSAIESKEYNVQEKVGKYLQSSDKIPSCNAQCVMTYTVTSYSRNSDERHQCQEQQEGNSGTQEKSNPTGQDVDRNKNLANTDRNAENLGEDNNGNKTAQSLKADVETSKTVSNNRNASTSGVQSHVSAHSSETREETNMVCSTLSDDYITAEDANDPGTPLMDERTDLDEDMPEENVAIVGRPDSNDQQQPNGEDSAKSHRDPSESVDCNTRTSSSPSPIPGEGGKVDNVQSSRWSREHQSDDDDNDSLPDIAMTTAGHDDPDVNRDDNTSGSERDTPSPESYVPPEDLNFSLDSSQGSQPHANPSSIMQDISSLG